MIFFLFILLPTLALYALINQSKILKCGLLKVSLCWFLGQYLGAWLIFVLSVILSFFTDSVLEKSALGFVLAVGLALVLMKDYLWEIYKGFNLNKNFLWRLALVFLCFLFSFLLFSPQLSYRENKIYTSPVYWDFNIHFPLIQNFVFGDNFPPQNESFSGVPLTYHYFFDLLTAIYSSLGLNLVDSINFVSVLSFSFMLMAIIGFGEEIFKSLAAGIVAALMTITSGSLHFLNYFSAIGRQNLWQILSAILENKSHPFFFSFIQGNPFGYNGSMFNIFYFVAERQLIFSVLFLILFLTLIYYRQHFSSNAFFLLGLFLSLFWEWHLFTTISVGAAILFLLFFLPERRKIFFLTLGFGLVSLSQFLYFHSLLRTEWFYQEIFNYPKVNLNFPTFLPEYPFSLANALGYYFYAYGLKLFLLPAGLFLLFKKNRQLFFLICSIIVPTFILVNSVQLSPLSVYDNHKWLRPMNVVIDLLLAWLLVKIFLKKSRALRLLAVNFFFMMTMSGFLELMPFLNSRPTNLYAFYPTDFIQAIRNKTLPQSSFLAEKSKELHLAGRKLFLGTSSDEPGATSILDSNLFNQNFRRRTVNSIYSSQTILDFCRLSLNNRIDFVQKTEGLAISSSLASFPGFSALNEKGEFITFLDIKKGCQ